MKSFTATKFREGYDPDEVDDFLDEVIWTIGQLNTENTELKAQLEEAQNKLAAAGKGGEVAAQAAEGEDGRVAELEEQLKASQARVKELEAQPREAATEAPVVDDTQVKQLQSQLAAANEEIEKLKAEAASQPKPTEAAAVAGESNSGDSESATSMLALAQRVHDEYVRDGQAEGNRIIEEARAQGRQLVHEAEQHRDQVIQEMEGRRDELQGRIEELKGFESDYRSNLRSHLESLLSHVNEEAH